MISTRPLQLQSARECVKEAQPTAARHLLPQLWPAFCATEIVEPNHATLNRPPLLVLVERQQAKPKPSASVVKSALRRMWRCQPLLHEDLRLRAALLQPRLRHQNRQPKPLPRELVRARKQLPPLLERRALLRDLHRATRMVF